MAKWPKTPKSNKPLFTKRKKPFQRTMEPEFIIIVFAVVVLVAAADVALIE